MHGPDGGNTVREIPLDAGDQPLLYTDGLAEVRAGDQLFGEDRIANTLRRDPGVAPDVLCKSLLEAARDFATEPMTDDVAILAIRRGRSEEHTSELQSLMRNSYAVFCLNKQQSKNTTRLHSIYATHIN